MTDFVNPARVHELLTYFTQTVQVVTDVLYDEDSERARLMTMYRRMTSIADFLTRHPDYYPANDQRDMLMHASDLAARLLQAAHQAVDVSVEGYARIVTLSKPGAQGGRPKITINDEWLIEAIDHLHLPRTRIARALGVSVDTVDRECRRIGTQAARSYTAVQDYDLDRLIAEHITKQSTVGATFVQGALEAKGVHIQRHRIRTSMQRVLAQ